MGRRLTQAQRDGVRRYAARLTERLLDEIAALPDDTAALSFEAVLEASDGSRVALTIGLDLDPDEDDDGGEDEAAGPPAERRVS